MVYKNIKSIITKSTFCRFHKMAGMSLTQNDRGLSTGSSSSVKSCCRASLSLRRSSFLLLHRTTGLLAVGQLNIDDVVEALLLEVVEHLFEVIVLDANIVLHTQMVSIK